jgi:hypothetical protein
MQSGGSRWALSVLSRWSGTSGAAGGYRGERSAVMELRDNQDTLIERARQGDSRAFEILAGECRGELERYIRSPPSSPFPECGIDPVIDALDCRKFSGCP